MLGKIKITDFGKRHFDSKFGGTKITDFTAEEFELLLNDFIITIENRGASVCIKDEYYKNLDDAKIMDGYAPFCKLVAIPNFTNAKIGTLPINVSNYQYLRHGYSSRTPAELPVLSRWFELPLPAPLAEYLIVVLYSKEQLEKEHYTNVDVGTIDFYFDADYGVVAILGQTHSNEEVMSPITMMRNALGIEEGGSGYPLDRDQYLKSVDFWSKNAIVK